MKMSAFGLAFSAVMRVWRSPAAASGSRSMFDPGYAALNAAPNWLFVVSFSAEYTTIVPAGALLSLGALYAGPFQSAVPSGISGIGLGIGALVIGSSLLGAVGGFVIGIVYRFGVLKRVDKVVGIPLGAVTAAVTLYVALVGVVTLDGWLGPLNCALAIR